MGKHGAPPLPWFQRPRQPFRLTGFTLRLVLPLMALGPLSLVAGTVALVTGNSRGPAQILVGLFLVVVTVAYFRRPVAQ